jgi:flagellum-specific peptidoglycan hydrolase FlgJ
MSTAHSFELSTAIFKAVSASALVLALCYGFINPVASKVRITFDDGATTNAITDDNELQTARAGIAQEEPAVDRSLEAARKRYIEQYANVAVQEMEKYGIPASITLAQGILESNAGTSKLVQNTNNHFGIKCFSKKCSAGHCTNSADDTHKDFFKAYKSAWASYRDHSLLLMGDNYRAARNARGYKEWAVALKKCGYATSKTYARDLVRIIERYNLQRFDG